MEIKRYTPKKLNEATLIHDAETGSEEWARFRQSGIGGSDIGIILGLNEWKSAYQLWAERAGLIDVEPVNNWSVRFGKAFEMPILQMWAEDNPDWEVFTTGTYCDNKLNFMQASPDALAKHKDTGEMILLEVKTARYAWDSLPPSYYAQVMHYLDVLSLNRAVVIAVAGWNWFQQEIFYDEFEAEAQRQAASNFMRMITEKREPDFDGSTSTYETLRKLHPDIDPDLEVEWEWGDQLAIAQKNYDNAEAELNIVKSRALAVMGKARVAYRIENGQKVIVATRQARGNGLPYLVTKKGK